MLLNREYAVCEICGEPRSKRVHRKCSRILQKRYNAEEYKKILEQQAKDDLAESVKRHLNARIRKIKSNTGA